MIDLISQLSNKDKEIIAAYIDNYGVKKEHFIGIDNWLQAWNHSNQTLYKMLGNKFIVEIPYKYEVPDVERKDAIYALKRNHPFMEHWDNFFFGIKKEENPIYNFVGEDYWFEVQDLTHIVALTCNATMGMIKIKPDGFKKMLQLQKGTKIIRAIQKFINYFSDYFSDEFKTSFEDFKTQYSLIANQNCYNGKICLSIHPMDFLTMSDNSLNWNSCMSWVHDGCYKIGTVESLNANNVICCYIKAESPFYFDENNKDLYWNNKKWRALGYINKDLIMVGKSYPYSQDGHSKNTLELIKEYAEKNLKYSFSFGPELYKDMKHIDCMQAIENNRRWLRTNNNFKHNIIFDTKGMYNDMLNNNYYNFWCYRNKVNKTKIISVSGKTPCLCCGRTVLEKSSEYIDEGEYFTEYNERYSNPGRLICESCSGDFYCDECGEFIPNEVKMYHIDGVDKLLCNCCKDEVIKKCPCCGDPFIFPLSNWYDIDNPKPDNFIGYKYLIETNKEMNLPYSPQLRKTSYLKDQTNQYHFITPIYTCKKCAEEIKGRYKYQYIIEKEHCTSVPKVYWTPTQRKSDFTIPFVSDLVTDDWIYENLKPGLD